MKRQVDDELSSCMLTVVDEDRSSSTGEDGDAAEDALYALNAWWLKNAEPMVEGLENICLGLDLPVFGRAKVDVDDMLIMNSLEAASVGGQLTCMNEYAFRSADEKDGKHDDDQKRAEKTKVIDQERVDVDDKADSKLTIVSVPNREWIAEKSDFVGRQLFVDENEPGNDAGIVWTCLAGLSLNME